jgi:hypothetical protein
MISAIIVRRKKGHWEKTCHKCIADGRPQKIAPQSNCLDTNIALCVISEDILQVETNSSGCWIDNGATKHVTNCPDLFIEFKEFQGPCVIKATIQIWSFTESNSLKMTERCLVCSTDFEKFIFCSSSSRQK